MNIPTLMCDGSPHSPICIIGPAPTTQDELREGLPQVGPDGVLLWSMAARAGFSRADAYVLNTIAEWPAGPDGEPTSEQLDKYWDMFDVALSRFTGSCILLLGATAFKRVVGGTNLLGWRGYLMPPSEWVAPLRLRHSVAFYKTNTKFHNRGDQKVVKSKSTHAVPLPATVKFVIPTLHPYKVIKSGFKQVPVLAYDVDRAWRVTQNALTRLDFSYNPTPTSLVGDRECVAVDIETEWSPGGGTGVITRVGVANSHGAWSAPWNEATRAAVQLELDGVNDRYIIGHNLAFDVPVLEKHGVRVVGKLFDTMLACQMLQPDLFKGLNSAASLYLDTTRWKHLSDSQPELYNAYDVIGTYYLYRTLREGLQERGAFDHFTRRIMPALRVLIDVERDGFRVDTAAVATWKARVAAEMDAIRNEFLLLYPTLSISSPTQVAKYIWGTLAPIHKFKANPVRMGADEATLRRLKRTHPEIPLFDLVLRFRDAAEYWKRFNKLNPNAKGLVYPSYAPATKDDEFVDYKGEAIKFAKGIAGTGRIQAKDPNPQQVTKDARTIFIPHQPTSVFLEFDYDSAELRVAAALSRDHRMTAALDGPINLHQLHADEWDCTRDEAKTLVYATMYGASPAKLMLVFSIAGKQMSQERCRSLQTQFFSRYPDFAAWRQEIINSLPKNKMLRNAFGRTRYFWSPKEDTPAALDFYPQSTVADIGWSVLPDISAAIRFYKGGLRTLVHDSFLFEVADPSKLPEVHDTLKDILQQRFDNVAPGFYLPAVAKVGPNWGRMDKYVPPA
jgi:uracil-DNA glycosylase family 4